MIRYIRLLFLLGLGLVGAVLALANRDYVTLNLVPEELAAYINVSGSVNVPLFLVLLAAILTGVLIGLIWEWLREYKFRRELSKHGKEVNKLQREVSSLKNKSDEHKDDVLAIIE